MKQGYKQEKTSGVDLTWNLFDLFCFPIPLWDISDRWDAPEMKSKSDINEAEIRFF